MTETTDVKLERLNKPELAALAEQHGVDAAGTKADIIERLQAAGPVVPAPEIVLRYIGDGGVFQSGIPNRDVTTDDNLSDDLADLAVATGTHEKVS